MGRTRQFFRWLHLQDAILHAYFMERYPKAVQRTDKVLGAVFYVVSHGAFALIVALLLVVLVTSDKISATVALCVGGAWLVAFVWIARSQTIRELTVFSRLFFVAVTGLSLAGMAMAFGGWALKSHVKPAALKPSQAFSVAVELFDTGVTEPNGNFNLWTVNGNSLICQVRLVAFLRLVNLQPASTMIDRFDRRS